MARIAMVVLYVSMKPKAARLAAEEVVAVDMAAVATANKPKRWNHAALPGIAGVSPADFQAIALSIDAVRGCLWNSFTESGSPATAFREYCRDHWVNI